MKMGGDSGQRGSDDCLIESGNEEGQLQQYGINKWLM
jgi:hypothetical protein